VVSTTGAGIVRLEGISDYLPGNRGVLIISGGRVTAGGGDATKNLGCSQGSEIRGVSLNASSVTSSLYEFVHVDGTVDLGGATLTLNRFGAIPSDATFTVVNNNGTTDPNGTFNGLAEGAVVNVAGIDFAISYVGSDGNNVTLGNANAPLTLSLNNQSVQAFLPTGTTVGTLSTTPGTNFTYSLVAGTGSTGNSAFTIAGNQLKTNDAFDTATQGSYSIRVQSTNGVNSTTQVFTITIAANPSVSRSGTTLTVNGTSGADILSFIANATRHSMNLNNKLLAVNSTSIAQINFVGNGGLDTVDVTGLGNDTAVLQPTTVSLQGAGYSFGVNGAASVVLRSSGTGARANFCRLDGRGYFCRQAKRQLRHRSQLQ